MPFDASIAGGAAGVALLPGIFQQFTKKIVELETMNARYLQHQESLLQQVSEMNTKLGESNAKLEKLEKLSETSIETNTRLEKLDETSIGTNAKLEKLGETSIETNAKLDKLGETNNKMSSQLEELRLQQHGISCPQTASGWCNGTS
jgi:chromosome segregation ATPase